MLKYASYNKRMSPYGNDLPGSRRPQTPHLVRLGAPHLQPFPPFLVALTSHLSAPPSPNNTFLLCLRLLSLNVMFPNLAQLQLLGNYLHLLNQLTLNASMWLLDTSFLYNQCALTFIEIWSASFTIEQIHITVRSDFDPLDPSTIYDPTSVNEPIGCKAQRARKVFLH
ncbi:hypothetical protein G6F43_002908 [Rhizopus delemar]|nr:hypothetical protein G6F43_002908 [Rhizopus delemar]